MSAITEALDELKGIDTKDKADRQQLRRRARRHAESDVKGSMGWFSSLTAGGVAESIAGRYYAIAYHGSQSSDIRLSDDYPLYLTSSKDTAADFARGSAFSYKLTDRDSPTVYRMGIRMANPFIIHSEKEYDRYMDIANSHNAISGLRDKGFDGIVYNDGKETYYEVFSPESQITVLDKQDAIGISEGLGTSAPCAVSLTESKEDIQSFIDKFGQDTYAEFRKSGQRLKNAGMSSDMLTYVHDDSMNKKKLDDILFNLANRRSVDVKDPSRIEGKYKFLGSSDGYDVYQPLDALGSMNLGVGSGWCTTGRYGHYGEKNFKPSLEDAEKHWNEYTSIGVKFFYFLQNGKGKYALALYPRVLSVNKYDFDKGYFLKDTNAEVYDAQDNLDYDALHSLPLDLIPEKIIINFQKLRKDSSGKLAISDDGKTLMRAEKDMVDAEIPDGVTSIGVSAFRECRSLESVTISDSVALIGKGAFFGCNSLKSVTFPNSVTSIGDYAFYNCTSLRSVVIPDNITSIGDSIFLGCKSLKSVIIPNSVTSIGDYAFQDCRSLKSVIIPDSVTSIGSYAFYGCKSLKSVVIPNSVTSIGYSVFYNCTSLESVSIPDGVTSIEYSTFYHCVSLQSVTIPDSVTSIRNRAFSDCTSLQSITIPDSVTSIEYSAFSGCISLQSVTIPNSVTSIGGGAFSYCRSLKSVVIPNSVTSIDSYAFYGCSSLKSITVGQSLFVQMKKEYGNIVRVAEDNVSSVNESRKSHRIRRLHYNPDAGNVEMGISMFNHAMGADASGSATGTAVNGSGLAESRVPADYRPAKTGKAYKVFRVRDGKLYPLMVDNPGAVISEAYRWHPSRTAAKAFAQKMDEIDDFCADNGIDASRGDNSYYFTLNGQKYRVSNHSVEASNRGAYDWKGDQRRPLYHPEGRENDVIYINAGKTRIMDIYNDLKSGYVLDGNGNRVGSPAKAPEADAGKGSANTEGTFRVSGPLKLSNDGRTILGVADKGIRSVSIPEGVTDIAYGAFYGCDRLESVFIPLGARIGYRDLAGIPSLKHVILQKGTPSNVWNSFNSGRRGLVSYGDKPEISESAGGGGHTPGESLDESKDDRKRFFDWLGSDYSDSIYKFDELRQSIKAPYSDFYWWMKNRKPSEFSAYMDGLAAERKQRDDADYRARKGAELVYEDSEWKVYHIMSYEASCKYGRNTKWCIAGSRRWSSNGNGKDFWDDYHGNGIDFYYFIRSNDEKYALTVYPEDGHVEIYNSEDVSVPYIPDAPKIPSIKADYSGSSQSDLGKLCMALATGKMSQRIAFALLGDTVVAYRDAEVHPQFMDSSPSGIDAVCSILDSSIPDDYLEYSAAWARKDDGRKLTSDETELIRDCGFSPDSESWDGDLIDLDPQSENEWVNSMRKKAVCSPSNPAFAGKKYFMYCTFDDGASPELQGEEDWLGLIRELMGITGVDDMLQPEIHSYFAGYREAYPHDGSDIDAFILMCINDGLTAIAMGNSIEANGGGADISPSELRDEFARLGAGKAFLDGVGKDERYTHHLPA